MRVKGIQDEQTHRQISVEAKDAAPASTSFSLNAGRILHLLLSHEESRSRVSDWKPFPVFPNSNVGRQTSSTNPSTKGRVRQQIEGSSCMMEAIIKEMASISLSEIGYKISTN